jgi:hypothetical protein
VCQPLDWVKQSRKGALRLSIDCYCNRTLSAGEIYVFNYYGTG